MPTYRIETEKGVYEVETSTPPKGSPEWAAERETENAANIARYKQDGGKPLDTSVGGLVKGAANTVKGLVDAGKRIVTPPESTRDKALSAVAGPLGPLVGDMVSAQVETGKKAFEAGRKGNYSEAAGYGLAAAIPLIGPAAAATAEKIGEGKISEGAGELLAGAVLPKVVSKVKSIPIAPKLKSRLNPVDEAAVAFGEREGIPLDAATRTGSKLVRNVQALSQKQFGGEAYAQRARQAQTDALAATGERLAERISPKPATPESAGAAVRGAVEGRITSLHEKANQQYGRLREIEADPKNLRKVQVGTREVPSTLVDAKGNKVVRTEAVTEDIALPVDMRPVKDALKPILDQMKRQMPIAEQRGSAGLKAIENILNESDFKQASLADADLSAIKAAARGAEIPALRNISQGLAAKAVEELDSAVVEAVKQAGAEALQSLQRGRVLTRGKYEAADILKKLAKEPVQLFQQVTFAKDSGVNLVRNLAKQAPAEMPGVARAYVEGLLDTATAEGGFGSAKTVQSAWRKLGPETKRVMFKDAALVKDLDDFFHLAKKMDENPNPSGTSYVASIIPATGLIVMSPQIGIPMVVGNAALSRILFSPRGSRALTRGLRMPLGNKAAATLTAGQILKMAGPDAKPLPKAAQGSPSKSSEEQAALRR